MWVVARYDGFDCPPAWNPVVGLFSVQIDALKALVDISFETFQTAAKEKRPIEEVPFYAAYEVEPEVNYARREDWYQGARMETERPEELVETAQRLLPEPSDGKVLRELKRRIRKTTTIAGKLK
jgi:hypothetical protein